jgi:hypothetical protein
LYVDANYCCRFGKPQLLFGCREGGVGTLAGAEDGDGQSRVGRRGSYGVFEPRLKRRIPSCGISGSSILATGQGRRILVSEYFQQIVVVPTGFESFSLDPELG